VGGDSGEDGGKLGAGLEPCQGMQGERKKGGTSFRQGKRGLDYSRTRGITGEKQRVDSFKGSGV